MRDVPAPNRYAGLLEATMDHVPSVCPIEPAELLDFCTDSGYSYRVEAQGSLLIPPDYYVGMTDWERSLRLRCVCVCPRTFCAHYRLSLKLSRPREGATGRT